MNRTFVIAVATAGALFAQTKAPDANTFFFVGDDRITTTRFVSGMNVGPTVTGAPYSAEAVNESVQTLYDGNRIVEKSTTKQYRDSEGRERREEGSSMNAIFITDPVAKTSFTLHPDTMTAEKSSVAGGYTYALNGVAGLGIAGTATAAVRVGGVGRGGRGGPDPSVTPAPAGRGRGAVATPGALTVVLGPQPGSAKVEDLGTKMLEGVQVKGTRSVTSIPAGQIGNDRAIEVVDERWYSPELQLTVMTSHSDPRSGQTTYKLTNIQRIEQVRSLFEVPSNYTVSESPSFIRLAQPAKKE
jgi:hypothetical protein